MESTREKAPRRGLASVAREFPGMWVAVDRSTGEPLVATAASKDLLVALREQHLEGVAVLRTPTPGEPQLVGLG